jgi:hypothetical protein
MATVELTWNPSNPLDPGPCIQVTVRNSNEVIEVWKDLGLAIPKSITVKALLDTGAAVSVISNTLAQTCGLFPTSGGGKVRTLGGELSCREFAANLSFPGTKLHEFDSIRIVSAPFEGERNYACLIGRDILCKWIIKFDGPSKRVSITD